MKKILSVFASLLIFLAVPFTAFATEGTFTATDYSFNPETHQLQFTATNFDPPRDENTGVINDVGVGLFNSSGALVLDYYSYNTGDCFEGNLPNLQTSFDNILCYNEYWHADLPNDDSPLYIRIAQSASGGYHSQAIPANVLRTALSASPTPTPTPNPVAGNGTFTATNYSFNPFTRVLQFRATDFNPPRDENIDVINDYGVGLFNSLGSLVLDYFSYNTGDCFGGNLPNLLTDFNYVVCANAFWHADFPLNNAPVYLRIAQGANGGYRSQPIPAQDLVNPTTPTFTPMPPTPTPTEAPTPTPTASIAIPYDGTFTASNYSFNPITNVLSFIASNFDPPRDPNIAAINDVDLTLYNSSNQMVLDYFSYASGDCDLGLIDHLTTDFTTTICYNSFWHADLPTDDTAIKIRIAQGAYGGYHSQDIPANEIYSTLPSPTPTPSVPTPNDGTFTASDYHFDPVTHTLQFTAGNFDPPRTEATGVINDFGISLYNSQNTLVLDYYSYNTGDCFTGNLPNLNTEFDQVVCYNAFWHADYPSNNTPIRLRIAQSASGGYHSQEIPAQELVASPTPVPTHTLSGTVYNDANENGFQEPEENGFEGATVTLSNGASVTTDGNGDYVFPAVPTDTYTETLLTPDGFGVSTSNPVNLSVTADTVQNFGVIQVLHALAPAQVWVGQQNGNSKNIKYDLMAEVYKDDVLVATGQANSLASGGQGFAGAKHDVIFFNPFTPVSIPTGTNLSFKLYVRNACSGSVTNGKTARLWYNDSAANSLFGATIGTASSNYYLLTGSALGSTVGAGPKVTSDVAAGAPCSSYKLFGTWAVNL